MHFTWREKYMVSFINTRNNKAFSAIEMMIVVAIIGILISIAVLNFNKIKEDVKKKACIANMGTIHNAVRMYYMENPVASDNLNISVGVLMQSNYLKTPPRCPNAEKLGTSDAFYSIDDVPGKKIDIICVNKSDSKSAHGSYLKLTNQDQKPSNPPKPQ